MANKPVKEKRSRDDIQSISRALDILEVLGANGGACAVTRISEECGIPAPTVYRILTTLMSRGYVVKNSRREYALGASLFTLSVRGADSAGSLMDETLSAMVKETQESSSVAVRDKREVLYVAHRSSSRAMRLFTSVGNRAPLHATGVGKALLASMNDAKLSVLLANMPLTPYTPNTIVTPAGLEADIALIRERGYSIDNQEQELGVRCVAACVPGVGDFAVSISGPPSRMTDEFIAEVAWPALQSGVTELSKILNGK